MFKVEVVFVWTLNEIENIFFYVIDLFSFVCLLSRFRPRDAPFTWISLNLKEIILKGNITCSIQWAQSFQSIQWAQHHILNSMGSSESIFDGPKFESNVIAFRLPAC